MNAKYAKYAAREWVEANVRQWSGIRGAHLVGSITTMPDETPFPSYKDIDVHLIFDEGSPSLIPTGPFPNIIEVQHDGLAIEAGIKPLTDYRSAEAVLANPEIAHHLTVDSVLYDPSGLLRDLQGVVRQEYNHRRWVLARVEHERAGLDGAFGLLPMIAERYGASGEANMLGYTTTFLTAALCVATLNPPRLGSPVAAAAPGDPCRLRSPRPLSGTPGGPWSEARPAGPRERLPGGGGRGVRSGSGG